MNKLLDDQIIEKVLENLNSTTLIKGYWKDIKNNKIDGEITLLINDENLVFNTEIKKELTLNHFGRMVEMAKEFPPFLPFGGIEENGEVILEEPLMELSVFGCKEVSEEALIILEGNFKVITLPGLCILKLIAWDEKPDHRAKDWEDFLFLLTNYHEIAGEQLYEGKHDDLFNDNFELPIASARMLGRNMTPILNKNQELKAKIIDILLRHLQKFEFEEIDEMYLHRESDDRMIFRLKLISETVKGINE